MGELFGTTIDAADPFFRVLVDDQKILTQACVLRLSTERATLWTDPSYGDAITDILHDGLTLQALNRLGDRVKAELEKDERIASVDVQARVVGVGGSVAVKLSITVRPSSGPAFPLTISISEVSVEVLTKGGI